MKAYLSRYGYDLISFGAAYLLAALSALPFTIYLAGQYFFLAYLGFAFIGVPLIVVVALVTAISDSYVFKFVIFVCATIAFAYFFGWGPVEVQHIYSWDWMRPYANLFFTVVLMFGLFYGLIERKRIAAWLLGR